MTNILVQHAAPQHALRTPSNTPASQAKFRSPLPCLQIGYKKYRCAAF